MSTSGKAKKKSKAPSAAQKKAREKFAKTIKKCINPQVEKLEKKHPKKARSELVKMAWAEHKKSGHKCPSH